MFCVLSHASDSIKHALKIKKQYYAQLIQCC